MGGENLADNHFNSTLDEFDSTFFEPGQSDDFNDIFSSSPISDFDDNQILSSFTNDKPDTVPVEDIPMVERQRQEIYYDDITKIYESISETDTKKERKKKKHHTLRNLIIIVLCLGILGAGVWVYRNHTETVIDLFYTVKDYVMTFIASLKDKTQQP